MCSFRKEKEEVKYMTKRTGINNIIHILSVIITASIAGLFAMCLFTGPISKAEQNFETGSWEELQSIISGSVEQEPEES